MVEVFAKNKIIIFVVAAEEESPQRQKHTLLDEGLCTKIPPMSKTTARSLNRNNKSKSGKIVFFLLLLLFAIFQSLLVFIISQSWKSRLRSSQFTKLLNLCTYTPPARFFLGKSLAWIFGLANGVVLNTKTNNSFHQSFESHSEARWAIHQHLFERS